jgi:hypothetical protein
MFRVTGLRYLLQSDPMNTMITMITMNLATGGVVAA